MITQIPSDSAYQIVLEIVRVAYAFLGHALCATVALAPSALAGFVAAHVYVLRREHLHHLVKYIFDKFECGLVAGAEFTARRFACAVQFGICGNDLVGVSRHLYFGYDVDITVRRIFDDFSDIVAGEISAIGTGSVLLAVLLALLSQSMHNL